MELRHSTHLGVEGHFYGKVVTCSCMVVHVPNNQLYSARDLGIDRKKHGRCALWRTTEVGWRRHGT